MRVSLLTLGCKTNQAESSFLEADLRARGWSIVDLREKPDVCVVNTCSVTAKTDYQSRQLIRRAGNTGSRVVVTGCYSELNRELVMSMQGVSLVVGNSEKDSIAAVLTGDASGNGLSSLSLGRSRLFIKVQDGCNGACSYCLIPRARGRSRSLEPDAIVQQIQSAQTAYNEVVLTAIHLGTYGYDLNPNVTLSYLIRRCLNETSIPRIRLSSLEITEIDEDLLDLLQDTRICRHLHIPLQSGDDRILKAMNRNYTGEFFSAKLLDIHKLMPSASIGTDVIVGFPGETDVEFQNTFDLLQSLPISYFHVFPFSARPGTPASQIKERLASATVTKRCSLVRGLSERKKESYMREHIGKTLDLLVETREGPDCVIGTTGNYLKVRAITSHASPKDLVAVRIAGLDKNMLLAHQV